MQAALILGSNAESVVQARAEGLADEGAVITDRLNLDRLKALSGALRELKRMFKITRAQKLARLAKAQEIVDGVAYWWTM